MTTMKARRRDELEPLAAHAETENDASPATARGGSVLVVDDDPTMCLLASEALEGAGFEVEVAENGEDALSVFRSASPDLVLPDVMMPVMDGFDACAEMKKLPGVEGTPIVMMTGSDDVGSIQRAYDVGATDFINKPVNYLIVTQRVRYMLRAKATADELKGGALAPLMNLNPSLQSGGTP